MKLEPALRAAHLREYARILRLKGDDNGTKQAEKTADDIAEGIEQLRGRTTVDV